MYWIEFGNPSKLVIPTNEVEIQHSLTCFGLQPINKGTSLGVKKGVLGLRRPWARRSSEAADVVIGRSLFAMGSRRGEGGRRHIESSSL